MMVVVDGSDDLGIVRHLNSQTRTSVEGFLATQHTGVTRLEGCQFQGVLIGLGTAVDQEQLVVVVATDFAQSFGQFHLQLVDHRVGVESDLTELLRHFLLIVGMGVPDADHSVAAIEVKILLTLVVPHLTTFALYDVHVEERIYVE